MLSQALNFGRHFLLRRDRLGPPLLGSRPGYPGIGFGLIGLEPCPDVLAHVDVGDVMTVFVDALRAPSRPEIGVSGIDLPSIPSQLLVFFVIYFVLGWLALFAADINYTTWPAVREGASWRAPSGRAGCSRSRPRGADTSCSIRSAPRPSTSRS